MTEVCPLAEGARASAPVIQLGPAQPGQGDGHTERRGPGSETTFQLVQNETPEKDKAISPAGTRATGFLFL